MKVIVAGSRGISDPLLVANAIRNSGFNITGIVSGGARGVDRVGERWAEVHNIQITRFLPDWNRGKAAGIIRNCQMGDYADALVAIWDGESKGTKHMIDYMRKLGKPVFVTP